jgi:hypothetical protein
MTSIRACTKLWLTGVVTDLGDGMKMIPRLTHGESVSYGQNRDF